MKTRIKLNGVNYRIKATYQEDVKGFPFDDKDTMSHNKYNITITNMENKKRISFKFYGSFTDWQTGKIKLDRQELIYCLYCLLNDGLSGQDSFECFCSNFGYDEDSRKAYKIYKACQRSRDKADKIGFNSENLLCDTLNYLSDNYNC